MSKIIPTTLGILIIVLVAGVAGASVLFFNQENEDFFVFEEEMIKELEGEEIAVIFDISLPVKTMDVFLRENEYKELSLYGTNVGALLKDSDDKELAFAYSRDININDGTIPGFDRYYFYIGADHPDKSGAEKISYGSKEEDELLKILESWDYNEWQPKNQLDNTKAFALMFIRELKGELPTHRSGIYISSAELKTGKMNRVYKNKELGFEINFPENWFVKERENVLLMQKPEKLIMSGFDLAGASPRISLYIEAKELENYGKSIEGIIDEFYKNWEIKERMLISGQEACFITTGGYGADSCSVVFVNNKFLYEIGFGDGCWGKFEDQKHLNIEKEILSTFKFLD